MFRQVLEYIYFLTGGPGLLIAALIALRSLRISKDAMTLTERRARLTATTGQITHFATVIAPLFDGLEEYINNRDVKILS